MIDGMESAGRPEPPTNLMPIPAAEVTFAAAPVVEPEPTPEPTPESTPELTPEAKPEPVTEPETTVLRPEPATTGSVWPGLTAAGLPTRVPRQSTDDESIKEAFFQSWEAAPTSPTPLTRAPFTPTYLDEPPRPRAGWADDEPTVMVQPPEPKEPPQPVEPPPPPSPPEPKEPPAPPTPQPGPTPFPSPTPVPAPPEPLPTPPTPVPPAPPGPPVPTPPAPFPPPPAPVPPPPAIVPGARTAARPPSTYEGGRYGDLATEPITGAMRDRVADRSGSLTGHLLSQEMRERRERRRKLRTVLWVVSLLLVFGAFLTAVVVVLAGDFISGLFDTLARWAG